MRPTRRTRLVLQLTPLLDLMLIVFFIQQIETQLNAGALVTAQQARAEVAAMAQRESEDQLVAALQELAERRNEIVRLRDVNEMQQEEIAELESLLSAQEEALRAQSRALAESFRNLLGIEDSGLDRIFAERRLSEDEQALLRAEFHALQQATPEEIVYRLQRMAVLGNLVDFWDLYLSPEGRLYLRIEGREIFPEGLTAESPVIDSLLGATRRLDFVEPKARVVLIYSYGNARRSDRRRVEEAVEPLIAALHARYADQSRFDFANLGWRQKAREGAAEQE